MSDILVMDDFEELRTVFQLILEKEGHKVKLAANGNEGLKIHCQDPSDLVIVDILMPDKEGIETIRELRQNNPDLKIIAMSGGGHIAANQYLTTANALGANCCLQKPIDMDTLVNTVNGLLNEPAESQ